MGRRCVKRRRRDESLESVAIALVLISSVMHAGWNSFGKSKAPTASFFLVATVGGLILLAFAPICFPEVAAGYTQRDLALVIAAGLFEAIYLSSLAGGYRTGDLSLVYPLARSLPAVTVTIGSVLLGRSDNIDILCWIGAGLIVIGCVFLPLDTFTSIRLSNYLSPAFLFAMMAALGTTGYSLADDTALRDLRLAHPDLHPAWVSLSYSFNQVLATFLWLGLYVFVRPSGKEVFRLAAGDWRHAIPTGAFIALTYSVVLVALAFTRDVSYVVAFRQASIPIGAAIGVMFFKEKMPLPKLAGIGIIVTGLILVSIP